MSTAAALSPAGPSVSSSTLGRSTNAEAVEAFPTKTRSLTEAVLQLAGTPASATQLRAAFAEQEIDDRSVMFLLEEDLITLGVTKMGPRKRILHFLVSQQQQHAALPPAMPEPRLLQQQSAPAGLDGTSIWVKADNGKVCFGAAADACLGRSGPGELTFHGGTVLAPRVAEGGACDATTTGALIYSADAKKLKVCDGDTFVATGSDRVAAGAVDAACDSSTAGNIRFDASAQQFEGCVIGALGGEWRTFLKPKSKDGTARQTAAKDCKVLLDEGLSTGDGIYWIDPDQGSTDNAFEVVCDMAGGGWIKIDTNYLNARATTNSKVGTASLSGNTVSMNAKSILEVDLHVPFTEYRMYLSASSGDGQSDPDDTSGFTDSAFLSDAMNQASVTYSKASAVRHGINIASFTPGNSCDNDGLNQVYAWGTDKRVHDFKIGGEFGCNFQGGSGTGFTWDMLGYDQATPETTKLRFKNYENGAEVFIGKSLLLYVR